jgi:phage terminase large subunit-like protein
MVAEFDHTAFERWRADPIAFIETVLCDPETGEPFVLLEAERNFLRLAFNLNERGRLLYPELLYSCPKKSGKTAFGAIIALTLIWLFGGAYPEAVLCANDLDQAQGRVFAAVRRIVECSPLLRREAQITQNKITFPSTSATIIAIGSDYAGAAGANQNIAIFDEAWAYTWERSRRLWDEMVPPPTRKVCTAIVVCHWNKKEQRVRLIWHRVYQPSPDDPLDFEKTIERTVIDLHKRFNLRKALFDPWQMQAISQRLAKAGLRVEEFPQTPANLTEAGQNLLELVQGRNLVAYLDPGLRLAISRAIAVETSRGWRISNEKQAQKSDAVIALAMAAHAAVKGQNDSTYSLWTGCVDDDDEPPRAEISAGDERSGVPAYCRVAVDEGARISLGLVRSRSVVH